MLRRRSHSQKYGGNICFKYSFRYVIIGKHGFSLIYFDLSIIKKVFYISVEIQDFKNSNCFLSGSNTSL